MSAAPEPSQSRRLLEEFFIPKCSSRAFLLKKGQVLRVIAHEGKQVADIRFLNANDYREQFSAANSISLNSIEGVGGRKKLKKLYSKPPWQQVMLTVIDDKVGVHLPGSLSDAGFHQLWRVLLLGSARSRSGDR